MNIEVISMWYNEEILAPFFLKHYEPASKIRIILDADTNDKTPFFLHHADNVTWSTHRFSDGMNTQVKQDLINQAYLESKADWVLLVDADEFINFDDLSILYKTDRDIFFVMLYQVYRHRYEGPLDISLPVFAQRRHGDPNITSGVNALYKKPVVARGSLGISWSPGCHVVRSPSKVIRFGREMIRGAHWAMADPVLIKRRMERKARRSQYNRDNNMGWHLEKMTLGSLYAQCADHCDDPEVL